LFVLDVTARIVFIIGVKPVPKSEEETEWDDIASVVLTILTYLDPDFCSLHHSHYTATGLVGDSLPLLPPPLSLLLTIESCCPEA
jgi:hypothetical protein